MTNIIIIILLFISFILTLINNEVCGKMGYLRKSLHCAIVASDIWFMCSIKLIINGALYFPEFQKQVRRGAVLKYEVR